MAEVSKYDDICCHELLGNLRKVSFAFAILRHPMKYDRSEPSQYVVIDQDISTHYGTSKGQGPSQILNLQSP